MDVKRTPSLRNTRFTEFLIQKNALDKGGFKEWVFCPGMLFNSTDKWWGDQGKRDKPHEGLDLCLYKDRKDTILRLGEKAKVPAIYDGRVVRIVDDFLGNGDLIFCCHFGKHIPNSLLSYFTISLLYFIFIYANCQRLNPYKGFRAFQFRIFDFGFRIDSQNNLGITNLGIYELNVFYLFYINSPIP